MAQIAVLVENKIPGETHITMTCRIKCISDICVGKHASLGIYVWGNMIPKETRITMTPAHRPHA